MGMTHRSSERALSLACVADQSGPAAALHEALVSLFPTATVTRLDTSIEQVVPDAVDCAVVAAEVNGIAGLDVLRRLRARGYAGPAVVITDGSLSMPPTDEASAHRLGARLCSRQNELLTPLAVAVTEALHVEDGGSDGTASAAALKALRQTQRLIAAGELATRLQHSLNNPLAALLAEAQLLELETLPQDHRESVERIIELCRRVIEVVRGMEGAGRA
jgi:signal transduction histidine kinase